MTGFRSVAVQAYSAMAFTDAVADSRRTRCTEPITRQLDSLTYSVRCWDASLLRVDVGLSRLTATTSSSSVIVLNGLSDQTLYVLKVTKLIVFIMFCVQTVF